jgi:hypothetical protein
MRKGVLLLLLVGCSFPDQITGKACTVDEECGAVHHCVGVSEGVEGHCLPGPSSRPNHAPSATGLTVVTLAGQNDLGHRLNPFDADAQDVPRFFVADDTGIAQNFEIDLEGATLRISATGDVTVNPERPLQNDSDEESKRMVSSSFSLTDGKVVVDGLRLVVIVINPDEVTQWVGSDMGCDRSDNNGLSEAGCWDRVLPSEAISVFSNDPTPMPLREADGVLRTRNLFATPQASLLPAVITPSDQPVVVGNDIYLTSALVKVSERIVVGGEPRTLRLGGYLPSLDAGSAESAVIDGTLDVFEDFRATQIGFRSDGTPSALQLLQVGGVLTADVLAAPAVVTTTGLMLPQVHAHDAVIGALQDGAIEVQQSMALDRANNAQVWVQGTNVLRSELTLPADGVTFLQADDAAVVVHGNEPTLIGQPIASGCDNTHVVMGVYGRQRPSSLTRDGAATLFVNGKLQLGEGTVVDGEEEPWVHACGCQLSPQRPAWLVCHPTPEAFGAAYAAAVRSAQGEGEGEEGEGEGEGEEGEGEEGEGEEGEGEEGEGEEGEGEPVGEGEGEPDDSFLSEFLRTDAQLANPAGYSNRTLDLEVDATLIVARLTGIMNGDLVEFDLGAGWNEGPELLILSSLPPAPLATIEQSGGTFRVTAASSPGYRQVAWPRGDQHYGVLDVIILPPGNEYEPGMQICPSGGDEPVFLHATTTTPELRIPAADIGTDGCNWSDAELFIGPGVTLETPSCAGEPPWEALQVKALANAGTVGDITPRFVIGQANLRLQSTAIIGGATTGTIGTGCFGAPGVSISLRRFATVHSMEVLRGFTGITSARPSLVRLNGAITQPFDNQSSAVYGRIVWTNASGGIDFDGDGVLGEFEMSLAGDVTTNIGTFRGQVTISAPPPNQSARWILGADSGRDPGLVTIDSIISYGNGAAAVNVCSNGTATANGTPVAPCP